MLKFSYTQSGTPIGDVPPRIRRAQQRALRGLAFDVRDAFRDGMAQAFDRPKPFTLNAFRVDAQTDAAVVWAMPLQARYLLREIEGGERDSKGFEHRMALFGGRVAIPDRGAKLDAFGNMSMATIRKSGQGGGRFFTGAPKGMQGADGVWERTRGGRGLRRVMRFADEASYTARLDIEAIAVRTVAARWESQLLRAMGH